MDSSICPLPELVKNHVKPLMRLFEQELAQYNMEGVDTKCLNTAVLLLFMMIGSKALAHTQHCDARNVQMRQGTDAMANDSLRLARSARAQVLSTSVTPGRDLFYMMMTDYHVAGDFFTGHVFILERIRTSSSVYYRLYQSYLNRYTLSTFFQMNKDSFQITRQVVTQLMRGLVDFYKNPTWTEGDANFWRTLTHTDDGVPLLGTVKQGRTFFCFRKIRVDTCLEHLRAELERKRDHAALSEVNQLLENLRA